LRGARTILVTRNENRGKKHVAMQISLRRPSFLGKAVDGKIEIIGTLN
jgi:hypothetical protein